MEEGFGKFLLERRIWMGMSEYERWGLNEGMNWNGKFRYPAAVNLLALVTLIREVVSNAWEFFLMCFCACSSKWHR
jgi:hypothetical protein